MAMKTKINQWYYLDSFLLRTIRKIQPVKFKKLQTTFLKNHILTPKEKEFIKSRSFYRRLLDFKNRKLIKRNVSQKWIYIKNNPLELLYKKAGIKCLEIT